MLPVFLVQSMLSPVMLSQWPTGDSKLSLEGRVLMVAWAGNGVSAIARKNRRVAVVMILKEVRLISLCCR